MTCILAIRCYTERPRTATPIQSDVHHTETSWNQECSPGNPQHPEESEIPSKPAAQSPQATGMVLLVSRGSCYFSDKAQKDGGTLGMTGFSVRLAQSGTYSV